MCEEKKKNFVEKLGAQLERGKMTLAQMDDTLKNAGDKLADYIKAFKGDARPGAKKLVDKYQKTMDRL